MQENQLTTEEAEFYRAQNHVPEYVLCLAITCRSAEETHFYGDLECSYALVWKTEAEILEPKGEAQK